MNQSDSRNSVNQSADLRTRIAAVIRREVPCHPPAADRIADAVIAELEPELNRHNTGCVCDDCWGDEHA